MMKKTVGEGSTYKYDEHSREVFRKYVRSFKIASTIRFPETKKQ